MRCLFTTIFSLLGLILLLLGAFLLYTSFIDSPEVRTDTLGGASLTQQHVFDQNAGVDIAPDLLVVRDGQSSSTNIQGAPAIGRDTITDLSQIDEEEQTAINEQQQEVDASLDNTRFDQATEAVEGLTDIGSNVVLKNEVLTADSAVQVVPLNIAQGPNNSNQGLNNGQGGATVTDGAAEQRVVEFEWPKMFRSGESGVIRITLKAIPGGVEVSSPEIPTNALIATPILLTDCYTNYDASVTARIVANEFDIDSTTTNESQFLSRGSEATWRWTLTPTKDGTFIITVALNIRWSLKAGASPTPQSCANLAQTPFTFWGQSVQVEVNKVFGLITIPQSSIAGTIFAIVGLVSQLPFASEIFGALFERNLEQRAERRRARRQRR